MHHLQARFYQLCMLHSRQPISLHTRQSAVDIWPICSDNSCVGTLIDEVHCRNTLCQIRFVVLQKTQAVDSKVSLTR
jgi:hypothetical protein